TAELRLLILFHSRKFFSLIFCTISMALSAAFYTSSQPSRALLCRTRKPNFSQIACFQKTPTVRASSSLPIKEQDTVGNGNSRKILLASTMRSMKRRERERLLLRTS
ncbi:unnamed protein product, partial [Prunus brigantina]